MSQPRPPKPRDKRKYEQPKNVAVIDITTRRRRKVPSTYINESAVHSAEALLEGLKSGRLTGFVAVTISSGREYEVHMQRSKDSGVPDLIGRLMVMVHDLSASS